MTIDFLKIGHKVIFNSLFIFACNTKGVINLNPQGL